MRKLKIDTIVKTKPAVNTIPSTRGHVVQRVGDMYLVKLLGRHKKVWYYRTWLTQVYRTK